MQVLTACATSLPSHTTSHSTSETVRPPLLTCPRASSRPVHTGRRKLTLISRVVPDSPSPSVVMKAQPIAASAMAARMPPCTVPMGLAWAGVGSSTTTASPGAKDSSRIPMSVAAGGGGISPRSIRSSILAMSFSWRAVGTRPRASLDLSMTFDEIQRVADDLLTALPNFGEGPASIEGATNDVVPLDEDADAAHAPLPTSREARVEEHRADADMLPLRQHIDPRQLGRFGRLPHELRKADHVAGLGRDQESAWGFDRTQQGGCRIPAFQQLALDLVGNDAGIRCGPGLPGDVGDAGDIGPGGPSDRDHSLAHVPPLHVGPVVVPFSLADGETRGC